MKGDITDHPWLIWIGGLWMGYLLLSGLGVFDPIYDALNETWEEEPIIAPISITHGSKNYSTDIPYSEGKTPKIEVSNPQVKEEINETKPKYWW